MTTQRGHRAPDEITAGEILDALAPLQDQGITASVEQTGGGVATVFVRWDGRELAIGPGRYEWDDPRRSVFLATFDTVLAPADHDNMEYIFHDWTDERIRATVRQAFSDWLEDDSRVAHYEA